jgi:hypothetical protein
MPDILKPNYKRYEEGGWVGVVAKRRNEVSAANGASKRNCEKAKQKLEKEKKR